MQNKKKQLEELGKYTKQLREAHGYSYQKLSELSGVSTGLINQLENGTARSFPKFSTLSALAKALGVSEYEMHKRAGYVQDEKRDKKISSDKSSFKVIPKDKEESWKFYFTSVLANLGFKQKYINEIVSYIQTVKLKQDIEEGIIDEKLKPEIL